LIFFFTFGSGFCQSVLSVSSAFFFSCCGSIVGSGSNFEFSSSTFGAVGCTDSCFTGTVCIFLLSVCTQIVHSFLFVTGLSSTSMSKSISPLFVLFVVVVETSGCVVTVFVFVVV
jgi:hypothetical protein